MENKTQISDALISKAVGCTTAEVVEEYALNNDDGNMQLVKKKVTTKKLAPDINAMKTLLEFYGESQNKYEAFSDEELLKEKQRLLVLLQKTEEQDGDCEDDSQD